VTRVLVVAESEIERAGLEALLARDPALSVVGRAARADGDATLAQQIEELDPDVVVVAMAGDADDGAPETPVEALTRLLGDTRTSLVLLGDGGPEWAADALRAGAAALLPRDAAPEALVAAVSATAAGLVVLERQAASALVSAASTAGRATRADATHGQDLTPRETEVLRMLAEGLANKQIAARLGISDHTVKFHVAAIFMKLGAGTRTEAVMLGARRGMIVI
jgi:DNA-binding NarL/FixJ family response regulator